MSKTLWGELRKNSIDWRIGKIINILMVEALHETNSRLKLDYHEKYVVSGYFLNNTNICHKRTVIINWLRIIIHFI